MCYGSMLWKGAKMQKVKIKIDGSVQEINVLLVFPSVNPGTLRHGVNLA